MSAESDSSMPPAEALGAAFHAAPVALLMIRAVDLVMVAANQPYLDTVGKDLGDVVGHHVFDVFPNSPSGQDQETDLRTVLESVIASRAPVRVDGLRYDIPSADGFDERWWILVESPILDGDQVAYLLHYTEDITELHRTRERLSEAEQEREVSAARTARLAEVALALTTAETVEDLERIVVTRGLEVLGADGGGLITRDPSGDFRVFVSDALTDRFTEAVEAELDIRHERVAYDNPLAGPVAARTGKPVILPDREAGLAFHPDMAGVYEHLGREAWVALPLLVQGTSIGAMAVGWIEPQVFTAADLELMEGFAAQCAVALDRLERAEQQRRTARRFQEVAESLQSAILTEPTAGPGVEVAVRYISADDVAQVGGDWYDAFAQPDGATMLAIGDVSGHDEVAAAKMGQLRGLLRALAYDAADRPHGDSPASVLTRLEYVSQGLAVDELSTAVLARIERPAGGEEGRLLRWTNAGNPPPVVLKADGTTVLLDDKPDLLLGVDAAFPRREHTLVLEPGSTLLLYTDGLIERRGASIDIGIEDLRHALVDLAGTPLGPLCDSVLGRLAPHTGEDDIAIVAVRV